MRSIRPDVLMDAQIAVWQYLGAHGIQFYRRAG
jgi:hypothetical protein